MSNQLDQHTVSPTNDSLFSTRSTALIIQERDGSLLKELRRPRQAQVAQNVYRAQIPAELLDEQGSLIDRIIDFAFDTLGAGRLSLRVRESE